MERITGMSVITYRDELLVELTGEDEYGDIGVVTYQFEYDDERPDAVRPKQTIEQPHLEAVENVLEENGYRLSGSGG